MTTTTDPAGDRPAHWLLRDEHGCALGITTASRHQTEREAWDALVGAARTPGLYLTKISSREWRETYREKFGRCAGPATAGEALTSTDHNMAPEFTSSAGEPPTDDELQAAYIAGISAADPDRCVFTVSWPGLRAVADLVDARHRAELDQARAERDDARDAIRVAGVEVERARAEIAEHRTDLDDAAELVRSLTLQREQQRDRADKALILAQAAINSLAQAAELAAPTGRRGWRADVDRYVDRLAALRGDTGEGRSTAVPVEPTPLLLAALDDAARYGAEGAGAVDLIHRHELEGLAHRLRTARPDTTTEDPLMCSPMPDIDPADIPNPPDEEITMPTVPHQTIIDFVRALGFDPAEVREVHLNPRRVSVERYARDDRGVIIVCGDEPATYSTWLDIDRSPRTGTEDGRE